MKFLLLFFIAILSLSSWACEYRLQKDSVLYNGYTINFGRGLSKVLADKGYERSYLDNYTYNVDVLVEVFRRRNFEFVAAKLLFEGGSEVFETEYDKRCYTQFCSTSDVATVLNKVLAKTRRKLGDCNE